MIAHVFRHREVSALPAVFLLVEGLQMDGGEVLVAADAQRAQVRYELVPLVAGILLGKLDDVNEPAAPQVFGIGAGEDYLGDLFREELRVTGSHFRALRQYFAQARDLNGAEGAAHVAEAVVVA